MTGPEVGSPEFSQTVADLFHDHAARVGVVGATLAVARGVDVAVEAFGISDSEGSLMESDTVVPIASVTKPMVATVISRLAATQRIDLRDPVARHLTELADTPWAKEATVAQLLSNTSGMPLTAVAEWLSEHTGPDALAEYAADLAGSEALWPPGKVWSYCNAGWSLLGRLIECVTKCSWEDATRELLLQPLGMAAVEFESERSPAKRSTLFQIDSSGSQSVPPWQIRALGPGGGSIWSTAEDLMKFGLAHCDDPSLTHLREAQAHPALPWFVDTWCSGWARFDGGSAPLWGWDGIGSASRAILRFLPDQRGVIALLVNSSNGRDLYRSLVPELLRSVFQVDIPGPPLQRDPTVVDLSPYEGTYSWPDFPVEVTAEGDELAVSVGGSPERAFPVDAQNFVIDSDGLDRMTIGFTNFENGRPQVLHRLVWGVPRTG